MKVNKLLALAVLAMAALTTGCTDYRTIPVSKVGKVVDNSGVSKETYQAGKRDIGWAWRYTKTLVLLDTSVETIPLRLTMRLADDQELTVQLLVKTRLDTADSNAVDAMFGMVTPQAAGDNTKNIPLTLVYEKLGQDLVRRSMVEVITPHSLESFRAQRKAINDTIEKLVNERFEKTPLMLLSATINDVVYPTTYITQANKIKDAEMSKALKAAEEEAKRARLMEEEKTVAVEQRVRLAKAETVRLENLKTSKGLNPMLLEYRKLELEDKRLDVDAMFAKAAEKTGNATIFYPSHQKPDYVDVSLSRK